MEGNVSGARAMQLEKQRQAQQEEFEAEIKRRQTSTCRSTLDINSKFQTARIGSSRQENDFRVKTVGLVSALTFSHAAQTLEQNHEKIRDNESENDKRTVLKESQSVEQRTKRARKENRNKIEKRKISSRLSFTELEDPEEDWQGASTCPSKKDPTIDTSFLPDKKRKKEQEERKKQLEKEWKETQERIRKESLEVTYSYWDGSGHRRSCTVEKGATVGDFLEKVRQDLSSDFKELSLVSADALLYVKEDLILPQDITFYDLIVTKARGKSGPLFHFDVHEDVRLGPLDRRVEKDESHPGKVVERRWYERNKHIFPASRWELYDPAKDYGEYTIRGQELR